MFPPPGLINQGPDIAAEYLARAGEAGINYVCCGDHVSFFGLGFDGLVQATALAMLHPTLPVTSAFTCCRCVIPCWWPASWLTSPSSLPDGLSLGSG